jgi:hypothetical protein
MLAAALGLVVLVSEAHARPVELTGKNLIAPSKPRCLLKTWELVDEMVDVFQKLSG